MSAFDTFIAINSGSEVLIFFKMCFVTLSDNYHYLFLMTLLNFNLLTNIVVFY